MTLNEQHRNVSELYLFRIRQQHKNDKMIKEIRPNNNHTHRYTHRQTDIH